MEEIKEIKKQISDLQSKVAKIENESKKGNNRWRAQKGGFYWYVGNRGDIEKDYDEMWDIDDCRFKTRNYFKTEDEAKEYREVMNTYYDLMDLADELNNGKKIDWNSKDQCKYLIYYDREDDQLHKTYANMCNYLGQIYCLDEYFKEKAIIRIGEDRLKKLFKYERS